MSERRVGPDRGVAIGMPQGPDARALAAAGAFIEESKRDGTVRRALDAAGFRDAAGLREAAVAPPGR